MQEGNSKMEFSAGRKDALRVSRVIKIMNMRYFFGGRGGAHLIHFKNFFELKCFIYWLLNKQWIKKNKDLDFYFPFLFGLLFPFSIWTFISLFFLDFYFLFYSFSILSRSLILDSSKCFFLYSYVVRKWNIMKVR